ncbi:hypothetical protein [Streptomyces sp. NPDC001851]|uniref:glutamate ligase domain-containing protein n=1 Tax=Streptomyces sp. NPDC001851 TaxID=3154529 RepID=UPI003321FA71
MARGHAQRAIAVLGRMNEPGDEARAAHEDVGRHAAGLRLDQLITVGGEEPGYLQLAARAAGAKAVHLPDQDTTLRLPRSTLRAGDVVLVNASPGARLLRVPGREPFPGVQCVRNPLSPQLTGHP